MTHSPQNLQGRTIVVTGASAGVGRATALRFARAGASLAMSRLPEKIGQGSSTRGR